MMDNKSLSKINMERCLLEAVEHMAIESLSPDGMNKLGNIFEELRSNRGLHYIGEQGCNPISYGRFVPDEDE